MGNNQSDIIRYDAYKLRQVAKEVRADLEHKGVTAKVCNLSEAAYEECIARSVLEREQIARTDTNIVYVLNLMKER